MSELLEATGLATFGELRELIEKEQQKRRYNWRLHAREKQLPPSGNWRFWVVLAGRGFGKTRTGAEYIRAMAQAGKHGRIALIGPTAADVRDVMIEGNALAVETPIPVPSGWKLMGDLRVGDEVFSADGTVTRVIAVSPVWESRPCHLLVSDSAAPIIADENHKWLSSSRSDRRPDRSRKIFQVRTTKKIADTVNYRRSDLCEYELPMQKALTLPASALPVPAYTLGVWLGDGDTRGHGCITCHPKDSETIEWVRADGFTVNRQAGLYSWGVLKLRCLLRSAGLIGNKHIPSVYLRASHEQRLDLLRGLMDTDGYVSTRSQCAFDNTNLGLVKQVRELLLTLGYKPGKIQQKKPGKASGCVKARHSGVPYMAIYRVTFLPGKVPPFKLKRKSDRCLPQREATGRLVRSADVIGSVPVKCIQVAHESGTFLAGEDFVVTHNSGILACSSPDFMPLYEPSKRKISWPNGVQAFAYSADEPERLRGPQHHGGWIDEVAAFQYPETFTQFKLGFRLGNDLRCVITTTPKPCPVVRDLMKMADRGVAVVVRGSTHENRKNLAEDFFQDIISEYAGTRLGRQEIEGELLEDTPGALWNTALLDRTRVREALPAMVRVVVAIDPSVTSNEGSDECGISVVGKGVDGDGYVLEDLSGVMTPNEWAQTAISAYHRHSADVIVGEANNGGDLVGNTILALDPAVPFRKVNASRGKHVRAEPISLLSEQNRFHLSGNFPKLEEQLCAMASDGYTGRGSPDRLDAMVWGATEALLGAGTVQMFPDFRARHRKNGEIAAAAHVYEKADLKDWWPRWIAANCGGSSAAHWFCREPSGRIYCYREFVAQDITPEEFGRAIAARSQAEAAVNRLLPVWMGEDAFVRVNGKSTALMVAEGIQRALGEHKAFLFVHNEEELTISDPAARWKAINARLDRMPAGFLSVQKIGGKDQTGWEVIRELLRWRSSQPQALQEAPDWEYARRLIAEDYKAYEAYAARFKEVATEVLPLLKISADCRALIQAMSGAVRASGDDTALSPGGGSFVLQSLRIGVLASREERAVEPMQEFVGRRMDKLDENASGISRHLVAVKAEQDWSRQYGMEPISFSRRRQ